MKPDEKALKAYVHRKLDTQLSFLDSRPSQRPEILRRIEEEKGEIKMKKKVPVALVCALLIMLVTVTALAAGLTFSSRYDVKRVAIDALKDTYGITDEMLAIFYIDVSEQDGTGTQVITFSPIEQDTVYAQRVGVYTVTVKNRHPVASWSLDGQPIGKGIDSPVYGPEQLQALLDDYSNVMIHLAASDTAPSVTPAPTPFMDEADKDPDAIAQAWAEQRDRIEAHAQLSISECCDLAITALKEEYNLTDAQTAKFKRWDDEYDTYFKEDGDQPIVMLMFRLKQNEDTFTEKDGQYWVDVNMDTGVIEDIVYDSGLLGNG